MYTGVHYDRKKNKVFALEIANGKTITQEFKPEYFFYIEDAKGKYTSITNKRLSKLTFNDATTYSNAIRRYNSQGIKTYEADVKVLFKTLERYYKNRTKQPINKSFFDIEVDFDKERGFSDPSDPFNRVTAISVYNSWEDTLYAITLPPKHMSMEDAEKELAGIPNTVICESEIQMFSLFFELIKDAHVLATWNGNFFDIPYLVNRVGKIMGKEATKSFCKWGYTPNPRTVEKYGKEQQVYDLIGLIHLDMLELYQKYTYTEQPSYSLDFISEYELGEKKVAYEKSLDYLYNHDYRKFIEYSRQDTLLLYKLDKKLDHINLAFTIAHSSFVDIKTVMGSIALVDNSIVLEAHELNLIATDKDKSKEDGKIAGAWVADPKVGITHWIGSVDLTSLYPSIFRALNLGNETVLGQVQHTITGPIIQERLDSGMDFAEAWRDIIWVHEYDEIINKTDTILSLELDDGEIFEMPASEIYDLVFSNGYILTANATIILNDRKSVISSLLERWFTERKMYQNRSEIYKKLTAGIELPDELLKQLNK